eukprot:GHVL01044454.1.p1 GENE.GHVL01044454.1~~GHVL01044454.1.p1  ORF type:complete len:102 (-),score=12.58 GHVL01044454.1:148-453(-)
MKEVHEVVSHIPMDSPLQKEQWNLLQLKELIKDVKLTAALPSGPDTKIEKTLADLSNYCILLKAQNVQLQQQLRNEAEQRHERNLIMENQILINSCRCFRN